MRFTKKIVERGNVTLPSDLREALDIEDGDFVEFEIVRIIKKDASTPAPNGSVKRAAVGRPAFSSTKPPISKQPTGDVRQ